MTRTTLARRGAAIGAASLVTLLLGLAPAAADPFVEVSRQGSKYSVDAAGVSVTDVLVALGREAGFGVEDSRPDLDRPIDIAVADATLEQTLLRVLERQNHLILYRRGVTDRAAPDAVARVVLLGLRADRSGGAAAAGAPNAPASPLAGPGGTRPARVAPLPPASVATTAAPADPGVDSIDPNAAMDAAAALAMDPSLRDAMPAGAESLALRHAQALEAAGGITDPMIDGRLPGELEQPLMPDPESDMPIGQGAIPGP